jgi:hypothetical protein
VASEEYKAIAHAGRLRSEALQELVANAQSHDCSDVDAETFDQVFNNKIKDFSLPLPSFSQVDLPDFSLDGNYERPNSPKALVQISEVLESDTDAVQDNDSTSPPPHLIRLLEKAERELLADISKLPHSKTAILKTPAVMDKYFPLAIFKELCPYFDLLGWFAGLISLEITAMPRRLDHDMMAARMGNIPAPKERDQEPDQPTQESKSGSESDDSRGIPNLDIGRSEEVQASESHLAVDRPPTPNPSPALSNDAGESLGNLIQLTERLEIAHSRTDDGGVVPQTRFASPANWQGKCYPTRS